MSCFSRLVIEAHQDSFNAYIGIEDHCGLSEMEVLCMVKDWINNEMKRIEYENNKQK